MPNKGPAVKEWEGANGHKRKVTVVHVGELGFCSDIDHEANKYKAKRDRYTPYRYENWRCGINHFYNTYNGTSLVFRYSTRELSRGRQL